MCLGLVFKFFLEKKFFGLVSVEDDDKNCFLFLFRFLKYNLVRVMLFLLLVVNGDILLR